MCGICGIYDRNHFEIDPDTLTRMRDVMIARGPDDAGLHISDNIGLGHRRLSIMDTSSAGRQPMCNENKTICVTFNGEIYNFNELREILAEKHFFCSRTDTEVLVHGYEEWGIEELLLKLNGMFAFAIWDSEKQELILARDRLGIKPLFYMEKDGRVYFSSDIKSICQAYEKDLTLDYCAIDDFLYSYCIPQERSIFSDIKKVLPAHYVVFRKDATFHGDYWHLSFASKLSMREGEYLEELENRLISAVRCRMMSDVPLGAFLSGGVDSSLVVALMANMSGPPVKTFSMGVREESYNELKYSRMVAEKYSTEHLEFMVEPDSLGILPELIWAYGEPFADSSQIPTFYISKITGGHVKVVLTGDGGDESFGGYNNAPLYHYAGRYRKYLPRLLRDGPMPAVASGLASAFGGRGVARKIKTLTAYGKGSFKNSLGVGGIFGRDLMESMYTAGFRQRLKEHDPAGIFEKYLEDADWADEVDKALYIDIKTTLPNDYLTKVDVATMMNSIEARSPFLDYRLMDFAAKIPSEIKIRHGRQKYLLKKLAARFVPEKAVYRKKAGFGIPIVFWFRRDEMKNLLNNVLLGKRAVRRDYFNTDFLRRLLAEHVSGKKDHGQRLWTLLCLELWHLMFVDKVLSKTDKLSGLSRAD